MTAGLNIVTSYMVFLVEERFCSPTVIFALATRSREDLAESVGPF